MIKRKDIYCIHSCWFNSIINLLDRQRVDPTSGFPTASSSTCWKGLELRGRERTTVAKLHEDCSISVIFS